MLRQALRREARGPTHRGEEALPPSRSAARSRFSSSVFRAQLPHSFCRSSGFCLVAPLVHTLSQGGRNIFTFKISPLSISQHGS